MAAYQAAMGLAQLGRIEHIVGEKRRVAATYTRLLQDLPGLQLPMEANWARNVYWMYALVVRPEFGKTRDELAAALGDCSIETRTFFCPMNQQPCLQRLPGFRAEPCPVADRIWEQGLYLPSTYTLSEETLEQIADAIRGIAGHA